MTKFSKTEIIEEAMGGTRDGVSQLLNFKYEKSDKPFKFNGEIDEKGFVKSWGSIDVFPQTILDMFEICGVKDIHRVINRMLSIMNRNLESGLDPTQGIEITLLK